MLCQRLYRGYRDIQLSHKNKDNGYHPMRLIAVVS